MPLIKSIGKSNYSSRPMEKTTSMNKNVPDNNNKAHYNKVGK
jgi:diketogulonate reductase-like aldo/keto reductase